MTSEPPFPRDLLDEIENELRAARASFTLDRKRLAALEELRELTLAVAGELDRPIMVFDLIRSAPGARERQRRTRLVHRLRGERDASRRIASEGPSGT